MQNGNNNIHTNKYFDHDQTNVNIIHTSTDNSENDIFNSKSEEFVIINDPSEAERILRNLRGGPMRLFP